MNKRLSVLKLPNILNGLEREIIEIDVEDHVFSKSLTDQSYYTPNSEMNKTLGTVNVGGQSSGAYDTDLTSDLSTVDDDLVRLRRPGNDIAEVMDVCKRLDEKARQEHADNEYKKARAERENAEKVAKVEQQSQFIDNLMSSSSSSKTE